MTEPLDQQLTEEEIDYFFPAAQQEWDLARLYRDLAKAKGHEDLSPMEKLHLRGLLCGHSPAKIAEVLRKKRDALHVDLAKTLYPYLKTLVNKENMENWRNFRKWVEEAGYKRMSDSSPSQAPSSFSISTLNISNVNIVINYLKTVHVEGDEYIDFSGRVGPLPSDNPPKKNKPN